MKVSIMITCYNCEDCIDTAIDSVVSQDLPFTWELLVGDDGSQDGTVAHINNWIARYPENIRLFVMERDTEQVKNGTRAARNRANLLKNATGEYLIFLDGDDQFLGTDKIKTQVNILDDQANKNCSCVAHNILANDIVNHEQHLLTEEGFKDGPVDTRMYWKSMYFHTNTILFRACCKELMLQEKYRDYLNDNFITYIILQYGVIYYLHDVWAQYNLTGNGLWTGKKRTYGCFRNMILYDLEKDINQDMEQESFIRHLYDFRYIFANYTAEDKSTVQPLVEDLPIELFKYTLLMYRLDNELTREQLKEKIQLRKRVNLVFNTQRIKRIPKKLAGVFKK